MILATTQVEDFDRFLEMADQLYISPKTADHHIQHIYTKIGVSNRASATLWAFQHDVVD